MSETWDHWFVGGDNSGDVMVWRNMVEMRSWVKEGIGDVYLVSETCILMLFAISSRGMESVDFSRYINLGHKHTSACCHN